MPAPSPSDPHSSGEAVTASAPDSAATARTDQPRMGLVFRSLEAVERVGNLLPHPFWLFWILALILGTVSAILAGAGVGGDSAGNGRGRDRQEPLLNERRGDGGGFGDGELRRLRSPAGRRQRHPRRGRGRTQRGPRRPAAPDDRAPAPSLGDLR